LQIGRSNSIEKVHIVCSRMANRIANHRRALRHAILGAFPGISLTEIAERVRSPDAKRIHFSDLESFCGQARIPVSSLPGIFSAYNVFVNRMTERLFIAFLRDEVTCAHDVFPLNAALSDDQISALSQFAEVVKSRKAQGYMPQIRDGKDSGSRTISFERFQLSTTWRSAKTVSCIRETPWNPAQ
jgi:hypothetical protein